MDFESVRELMRRIDEDTRVAMPWRDWARRHRVKLHLSPYAKPGALFVTAPVIDDAHMVVTSEETWGLLLKLVNEGVTQWGMQSQELAEMVAWHGAELREPSEIVK